jgi:hypothetical protein
MLMFLKAMLGHGTAGLHSMSTTTPIPISLGTYKRLYHVDSRSSEREVPLQSSKVRLLNCNLEGVSVLKKDVKLR